MDASRISVRYAKAAFEFASEKGEETRLYEEMKVLEGHFRSFKLMRRILDDPTVPGKEKEKVLTTAAGISVSESFKKVLGLIIHNKRENYIHSIALMYQVYYRKKKDTVITRLVTTEHATTEVKDKIVHLISNVTNEKVDLVALTDPSIIGGFILELEDQRLDASVRHQLNQLRQLLT